MNAPEKIESGIEIFQDFNFDLKPEPSALDRLLTKILVAPYLREPESGGCLVPLPFQTGIGKTYTALNLILEEVLHQIKCEIEGDGQPCKKGKIIYITDSVDNVLNAYSDLHKLIDDQEVDGTARFTDEQAQYLKQKILYLPNQATQLLSCSAEDIARILEAFELDQYREISREVTRLFNLQRLIKDKPESKPILNAGLENDASKLYSKIADSIRSRQRSDQPVVIGQSLMQVLGRFLPGELIQTDASNVMFMTTQKYLAGCHHTKGKYRPLRDLENQLLIIDEVDKQNLEILGVLTKQRANDLVSSLRTLERNLNRYRLENAQRYDGIDSFFDELRSELLAFDARWHIEYAFNTDGDSLHDKPLSLFSDRAATHVHTMSHRLSLQCRHELKKNLIVAEEKLGSGSFEDKPSNQLTQFVNEADRLYQRFFQVMQKSVRQYQTNIAMSSRMGNSRLDKLVEGTQQEAVLSILAHYNLSEFAYRVLEAFDRQGLGRIKSGSVMTRASYHQRGLKLVDVGRNQGTHDTVHCSFYGFQQTPSALLLDMVNSGARILGVSATADAQTVLHNFDFKYLNECLGERLVTLNKDQRKLIHDYYAAKRDYVNSGVKLSVNSFRASEAFLVNCIEEWMPGVRTPGVVLQQLFNGDGDSCNYEKSWLSKLLQSIKHFCSTQDNRYMVAMLNRTVSADKYPKLIPFLNGCINRWLEAVGQTGRLFVGVNATFMKDGGYRDEILQQLENEKGKVIVLSTYASMGAGKNPDYCFNPENENDSLVYVSDRQVNQCRTDIDAIYLERPTQLLPSIDDTSKIQSKLVQFHNILSLQETGEISPVEAKSWCLAILNNQPRPALLKRYYQTDDYRHTVCKLIEQAVGRTARTAFKRREIHLFADHELVEFMSEDHRDTALFSNEYTALVDYSKQYQVPDNKDRMKHRQQNLAIRNNKESALYMFNLLARLMKHPDVKGIQNWEAIREQLLEFPTGEESHSDWSRFYVESPLPSSYRYDGDLDNRNRLNDFHFFDFANEANEVSEHESGLTSMVKNDTVRQWFIEHGWATCWKNSKRLMTPVMFTNIYKGALGEQACIALLDSVGLEVDRVPIELYEHFDGVIKSDFGDAFVDFKHWQGVGLGDPQKLIKKLENISTKSEIKRFVFCNALGTPGTVSYLDSTLLETSKSRAQVITIPALIDSESGETIISVLEELAQWLCLPVEGLNSEYC
ncbi:hypothetical protein [Alkalimarinus alittae]|uniref:Helicase n=1 Tax=Alkalimarinus alittae TaxID=2961619 RepID=A0ABY6MXB7_9ALTE|nr:hypothetical protein [Alkalimarinus alittae]UZE94442.1 hypothetical protein NKI27_10085 [Alkalimarinus alittae]